MGRDEELAELITPDASDGGGGVAVHGNGKTSVDTVKENFAKREGVGKETVRAIFSKRGVESRKSFIEEACATLKASGEHDKIVARVSAECRAAQEAEAELIRVAA